MNYSKALEDLKNQIMEKLENSSSESEFFLPSEMIDEIKDRFYLFYNELIEPTNTYTKLLDKHDNIKKELLEKYNNRLLLAKKDLLDALKEIVLDKVKKINGIKNELEGQIEGINIVISENKAYQKNLTKKTNNNVYSYLLQRDFEMSNYQHMHKNSRHEYINSIDFFYDKAKFSTNSIHSNSSKILMRSDEAYSSLVTSIEEKIKSRETLIVKIEDDMLVKQEKKQQQIVEVSSELNKKISLIMQQLTDEIELEEQKSDKLIKDLNLELEKVKENHLLKNKETMRKFVDEIDRIDEVYNAKYKLNIKVKENMNQKFFFESMEIERQINQLKKSNANNKIKNKEQKELILRLNDLKKKHHEDVRQSDALNRQLLLQTKASKYYQELEKNKGLKDEQLIEECFLEEYNKKIEVIKNNLANQKNIIYNEYEIIMNDLKNTQDILIDSISKDIVTISEVSKNKIFSITKEIEDLKAELNYNKQLHDLIHSSSIFITNQNINMINTVSLLNIENNKLLQDFNYENYVNLTNFEKSKYIHKEREEFTKRDYHINLKNIENEYLNNKKKYLTTLTYININYEQLEENMFKSKKKANYIMNIGKLKYKLYSNQLRIDRILFIQTFDLFYKLTYNSELLLFDILDRLLTSSGINLKEWYLFIIEMFIQYKRNCIDIFYKIETEILRQSKELQSKFIMTTVSLSLEEKKHEAIEKILLTKKALNETLTNYEETLKTFVSKKAESEEKISILRKLHKYGQSEITNEEFKVKLKEHKIFIKDLNAKMDKNETLIQMIKKDLSKIPNKIKDEDEKFKRNSTDLDTKISYSLNSYKSLNDNFDELLKDYNDMLDEKISYDDENIIKVLKKYKKEKASRYKIYANYFKSFIYKYTTKFNIEHKKYLEKYINKEQSEIKKINKNQLVEKRKLDKRLSSEEKNFISSTYSYYKNIEFENKKFQKDSLILKKDYDTLLNDFNENKERIRAKLFNKLLAMNSNINHSKSLFKDTTMKMNKANNITSSKLLKEFSSFKSKNKKAIFNSNEKLNVFLQNQPIVIKESKKILIEQNKAVTNKTNRTIKNNKNQIIKRNKTLLVDIENIKKSHIKDMEENKKAYLKEVKKVDKMLH